MAALVAEVYKGYFIRSNLRGEIWVEKDSVLICWAKTLEEAKQKINQLLSDTWLNKRQEG